MISDNEKTTFDIQGEITNETVYIQCPVLVPHRKKMYDAPFLNALESELYRLRSQANAEAFIQSLRKGSVVVFTHNYESEIMIRDNDNVEAKRIVDSMMRVGLMGIDTGTHLTIIHRASMKSCNGTEIMLFSKNYGIAHPELCI